MTYPPTLSQSFDIGDFIAPDILSVVDASVRAAAEDIIERGSLSDDFERIFNISAGSPVVSEAILRGDIPSMDPDEFLPYEQPETPVISELGMVDELPESADGPQVDIDPAEVDIVIPDMAHIQTETPFAGEDMVVEIPEITGADEDIMKVNFDTRRFEKQFEANMRVIALIVIIAAAIALLIIYLLHQ